MPATSVAQRRYFGMVESGKIAAPHGMSAESIDHFAKTKEAGLPAHAPGSKSSRKSRRARIAAIRAKA